jgi:SAM-dependent methyltransferase
VIDPQREEAELRAYLGDAYDRERLVHYDRQLEDELAQIGDEETLYRTSQAYLYNLTAFAMTNTKEPYLDVLRAAIPLGSKVLDYGCGIGSDGLALIEAGYDVAFADFDNPSVRYLRWRLQQRGRDARIYDLDREQPPDTFDLAYSFDVIEHVPDPFAFVERLEASARMVLVNFLEPVEGETDLHHDLPVDQLVRHAAARRLLRYEVFHGRSHLVLYDRRAGGRLRARIALVRGSRRRG